MDRLPLGKHNPRLIEIRKALDHGTLTDDGLLPVESPKLIREAVRSGLPIVATFVRAGTSIDDLGVDSEVYSLDPAAFKKIQTTETSQGVLSLVRPSISDMEFLFKAPNGPIVVLGHLQDPGNVGTILRIAESFGAAGCIGLKDTASLYNSKAVRASAGSVFRLPTVWNAELSTIVARFKSENIPLVGTSSHATKTILERDWTKPAGILIGNEGGGLNQQEMDSCDTVLRIPHQESVESLNSAVAAAVILYEGYRQRFLQ